MDKKLEDIIKKINKDISETEEFVSDMTDNANHYSKRVSLVADDIEEAINMLISEDDPETIDILNARLVYLETVIDRFKNVLHESEEKVERSKTKLDELKKSRAFVKLSSLDSFQSKNSTNVNKVLSNPDLTGVISSYLGGKTKRKHKKRTKKNMTKKQFKK